MKKVAFILAIAFLASCGNNATTETSTTADSTAVDSTVVAVDSSAASTVTVDTLSK
jgi:hypothetical protein